MELSFGNFVSTSNQLREERVTLVCSEPCIWTTSLKDGF